MSESKLSTAEAELYDRQIRLWGIESQEKLRAANVLLIKIRGLGSEIAKDILLCGINSLTILDDALVTEEEIFKNFLLSPESVGKNIAEAVLEKAQALNPLVKITPDSESVDKKNAEFFAIFTVVIATGLNSVQVLEISKYCRDAKVKFICGDNFGMFGYSFADFQTHEFFEDKVQLTGGQKRGIDGRITKVKSERTVVKVCGKMEYVDLSKVIKLPEAPMKPKRRNIYYYLMLALLQFRDKFNRDPMMESKEEDVKELKAIKDDILKLYQVNPDKFKEEVFDLIFGEVVPVCSIVGGVMAQEAIKAVSGKEVPINNVFLLDPFNYSGREENVV
ncbi:PREDICTED: SUMO-activating enzyme subunit 1 [Nicrophorus vespilloides]|uniref:SUMO-activating enzyme subunit 1 n=1 Tax=Nicrophorus vespilloides TaxID=110193 RepID=A0ABM1NBX7_NICVS|nr:PREDICTED: SUMO-activating enzyme subunit 1 [Nicrophorus vespilloides]